VETVTRPTPPCRSAAGRAPGPPPNQWRRATWSTSSDPSDVGRGGGSSHRGGSRARGVCRQSISGEPSRW